MNKKIACLCSFLFLILSACCLLHRRPQTTFAQAEKTVYLTFDDGPSDRITPKVLSVLRKKGVNATFFLIGRNAERRELLTRRILAEGNSVGIHSYSHDYSEIYASPESLLRDIEKCSAVLNGLGVYTRLYRFPGGSSMVGEEYKILLRKKGYVCVDWNALCGDAEPQNRTADELYERTLLTAGEKKKIVLLLHDSTDKAATVAALPRIIDYFLSRGYVFGTMDMA